MKVGFTGSRKGMTNRQWAAFKSLVREADDWTEYHHGDCGGCDDDSVIIIQETAGDDLTCVPFRIVRHPPTNKAERADNEFCHETRPAFAYLTRNQNIVDACDTLVACPNDPEVVRSGTWSTVRYARKRGKKIVILWPDGRVTRE